MGEAILGGAIERGVLSPGEVTVVELIEERRQALCERYGVAAVAEAGEVLSEARLVLLAVKPQEFRKLSARLREDALLLSIMAGVRIETLAAHFGHERIVRVMPNTPAAISEGMSVWTATPSVDASQRETVRDLLGAIGRELSVEDEGKLDMATALSGSGPAYVFLFIEALIDAGGGGRADDRRSGGDDDADAHGGGGLRTGKRVPTGGPAGARDLEGWDDGGRSAGA